MSSGTGTVTVGTTPTLIFAAVERPGVIVQNSGETPVFLGTAATVAASGTPAGLSLAAGATLTIPFVSELFAVVASDTGTVAFIAAG